MSTDIAYELLIGAKGWNHENWQGQFYPDDIPDDWRLTYYANEFQTVLVPESDWVNSDNDSIEQWLDDTDDSFVFYFEISLDYLQQANSASTIKSLLAVFDPCPERLGALIVNLPVEHNTDNLPPALQDYSSNHAIVLNNISRTETSTLPDQNHNTDISWHHSTNSNKSERHNSHFNVGFIDTSTALSNKELRCQLEQYQSKINPQCPTALFLYGDPPDISNLRDIKMIKELIMG